MGNSNIIVEDRKVVQSRGKHIGPSWKFSHKTFIVVPAYNEEKTVGRVLNHLIKRGYRVVVVDDGSSDNTHSIISKARKDSPEQIFVCQHLINQGLGAALKTGMDCALNHGAEYMVTFDADCQHDPEDIKNILIPLKKNQADVVLGVRNFDHMPLFKKMGNQIMNTLTFIFYREKVSDSQSGLRALNKKSARLLRLHYRGYGVSSEIIREIKNHRLKMVEIPIKTIYTDYSLSKGTNTSIGLEILFKMILDVFKKF